MPSESQDVDVLSHEYLMKRQQEDNVVKRVIYFVERGQRPNRRERMNELTAVLKFMKHWEQLLMKNGVLHRVSKNSVTKKKTYLYVVPDAVKTMVLKGIHDQAGHQGQQRTLYLARQRFFWLGLEKDVREPVISGFATVRTLLLLLCALLLIFVLFSDLSKIFTSADQHSAQTTHFLEKRTLCLPLPAVYIPETDKYSCLHSNR